MTVFQCLPSYRPIPTLKVINSLQTFGCRILLDIEDGIQDIINPSQTSHLKRQARVDLLEICRAMPRMQFDIRINALNTKEQLADELLLNSINNCSSVFIPKVESADELEQFSEKFDHRFRLNIIIETRNGVHNIDKILRSKVANKIEYVFFGNYDYHLDTGSYPLTEQNETAYWDIVLPLMEKVEAHGFHFGNSPYARIGDLKTLKLIMNNLNVLCKNDYAVVSLHRKQTMFYTSSSPLCSDDVVTATYESGKVLLQAFLNKRLKGRSFAFIDADKRIITPHEYLLLKVT